MLDADLSVWLVSATRPRSRRQLLQASSRCQATSAIVRVGAVLAAHEHNQDSSSTWETRRKHRPLAWSDEWAGQDVTGLTPLRFGRSKTEETVKTLAPSSPCLKRTA